DGAAGVGAVGRAAGGGRVGGRDRRDGRAPGTGFGGASFRAKNRGANRRYEARTPRIARAPRIRAPMAIWYIHAVTVLVGVTVQFGVTCTCAAAIRCANTARRSHEPTTRLFRSRLPTAPD